MLGKMLIHGLVAAALIGSAAAAYAQAKDNGYLPAPAPAVQSAKPDAAKADNGYLRPAAADLRGRHDDHHDRAVRSDRDRERHDRKRDHDDDDD